MSEQKIVEDLKERYDRCCDPDDECYSAWEATLIERISRAESQVASLTAERDECNRMLVIESNAAEEYQKALTTERGLRDASEQENGLLRSERDEAQRREIVVGDLSMLIRMMVTKHRRGKLDEDYCLKALDYLKRKGLQGNVLRTTETAALSPAVPAEEKEGNDE
jgi:hypothetical protein